LISGISIPFWINSRLANEMPELYIAFTATKIFTKYLRHRSELGNNADCFARDSQPILFKATMIVRRCLDEGTNPFYISTRTRL